MSEAGLSLAKYDHDIYAWAMDQADLMRALIESRANTPLDLSNLIEEVEALARTYKGSVRSQVRRAMEHLLKLEFSRSDRPHRGWKRSIIDARAQLQSDLTPTLRRELAQELEKEYEKARMLAVLGLEAFGELEEASHLPAACPYALEQILDDHWYPASRAQQSNH